MWSLRSFSRSGCGAGRSFRVGRFPSQTCKALGTGNSKSTWKDAVGQGIPAIPAKLVIRQTFSSVSCALFTGESESWSIAAQISRDDDSGALYLNYNYTNRPKATIRNRSAIHDGAARLRIISVPGRALEGEYWTGRCTTGDMSLKFKSRELSEGFSKEPSA